jgi:hypothetical protein
MTYTLYNSNGLGGANPRPGGEIPLPHEGDSNGTGAAGNVYFWKCFELISM